MSVSDGFSYSFSLNTGMSLQGASGSGCLSWVVMTILANFLNKQYFSTVFVLFKKLMPYLATVILSHSSSSKKKSDTKSSY